MLDYILVFFLLVIVLSSAIYTIRTEALAKTPEGFLDPTEVGVHKEKTLQSR